MEAGKVKKRKEVGERGNAGYTKTVSRPHVLCEKKITYQSLCDSGNPWVLARFKRMQRTSVMYW